MCIENLNNIVHKEIYILDRITYTIYVTFIDGMYWGHWFCETCKEKCETSRPDVTIKRAVFSAETNTGGHHWANHKK